MSQFFQGTTAGSLPPSVPTSFVTDSGTAIPVGNILNVLGSAGTSTSGLGNTITIMVTGSGLSWNLITASQSLAPDNAYICVAPGGAISLSLPAVSSLGEEIEVVLNGATSWTITLAAGQSIRLGIDTAIGPGGSISSLEQGDWIRLVCQVANTTWIACSDSGNFTVVSGP